jgi:hypothetical protein
VRRKGTSGGLSQTSKRDDADSTLESRSYRSTVVLQRLFSWCRRAPKSSGIAGLSNVRNYGARQATAFFLSFGLLLCRTACVAAFVRASLAQGKTRPFVTGWSVKHHRDLKYQMRNRRPMRKVLTREGTGRTHLTCARTGTDTGTPRTRSLKANTVAWSVSRSAITHAPPKLMLTTLPRIVCGSGSLLSRFRS